MQGVPTFISQESEDEEDVQPFAKLFAKLSGATGVTPTRTPTPAAKSRVNRNKNTKDVANKAEKPDKNEKPEKPENKKSPASSFEDVGDASEEGGGGGKMQPPKRQKVAKAAPKANLSMSLSTAFDAAADRAPAPLEGD